MLNLLRKLLVNVPVVGPLLLKTEILSERELILPLQNLRHKGDASVVKTVTIGRLPIKLAVFMLNKERLWMP